MSKFIHLYLLFVFIIACEPKAAVSEGPIFEAETESSDDTQDEVSDSEADEQTEDETEAEVEDETDDGDQDEDEDEDEDEAETETDAEAGSDAPDGFVGAWSTCNGRLTRDAERFSWEGNLYPCSIRGDTDFVDGVLTLHPDDLDECDVLPWWFAIFDGESPSFVPAKSGTRLTMLPTIPTDPARVLNLEETLVEEKWDLLNQDDQTSAFKLCWTTTGEFFEGRYLGLDGSCSFLSCGGVVTQLIIDEDDDEHWSTQCGGTCPCGGVVTVEERTDTSLSGRYNAVNCARIMDGTFTATPRTE